VGGEEPESTAGTLNDPWADHFTIACEEFPILGASSSLTHDVTATNYPSGGTGGTQQYPMLRLTTDLGVRDYCAAQGDPRMTTVRDERAGTETGVLPELLREFSPVTLLRTAWRYFKEPIAFFDEVFARNWRQKTPPVPFFLACMSFALFALTTSGALEPEWTDAFERLSKTQMREFLDVFELHELVAAEQNPLLLVAAMKRVVESSVKNGGLTVSAKEVAEHLRTNGHSSLADSLLVAHYQKQEESSLVEPFAPIIFLSVFLLPHWTVMGWLLRYRRPRKDTVYVMLYSWALLWVAAACGFGGADAGVTFMIPVGIILGVATVIQTFRIFRRTHRAGFWMIAGVNTLAGMISGVITLIVAGIVGAAIAVVSSR
jgi:hypothetical protein